MRRRRPRLPIERTPAAHRAGCDWRPMQSLWPLLPTARRRPPRHRPRYKAVAKRGRGRRGNPHLGLTPGRYLKPPRRAMARPDDRGTLEKTWLPLGPGRVRRHPPVRNLRPQARCVPHLSRPSGTSRGHLQARRARINRPLAAVPAPRAAASPTPHGKYCGSDGAPARFARRSHTQASRFRPRPG